MIFTLGPESGLIEGNKKNKLKILMIEIFDGNRCKSQCPDVNYFNNIINGVNLKKSNLSICVIINSIRKEIIKMKINGIYV